MKKVFTPQEVAQFLHVSPATIYAELQRGKLPHSRVGRRYIITRRNLEDYLSPDVVSELLSTETDVESAKSEMSWLDVTAEDMAKGIAAAEKDIDDDELSAWYKQMEAAVKPLEHNHGKS